MVDLFWKTDSKQGANITPETKCYTGVSPPEVEYAKVHIVYAGVTTVHMSAVAHNGPRVRAGSLCLLRHEKLEGKLLVTLKIHPSLCETSYL